MQFRQQSAMRATGSDAAPPPERIVSPARLEGWREQSFNGQTAYRVEDDGKGMDASAGLSSTGVQLLNAFTQQLGGRLSWQNTDRGTSVSMVAPWSDA